MVDPTVEALSKISKNGKLTILIRVINEEPQQRIWQGLERSVVEWEYFELSREKSAYLHFVIDQFLILTKLEEKWGVDQ